MKTAAGIFGLLFFLTACGAVGETDGQADMEGTLMGSVGANTFLLFVEDNITGTVFEYSDELVGDSYEAEIYKIVMDQDTKLIYEETGEELSAELSKMGFNTIGILASSAERIKINVRGDFEPEVTTGRDQNILLYPAFIPIHEADEIILPRQDLETILDRYDLSRYHSDNAVAVLSFLDEVFLYESMFDGDQLYEYSAEDQHVILGHYYNDEVGFFDHFIDEYPTYYVVHEDGVVFDTHDIQDVTDYLEDELGFERMDYGGMIEDDNGSDE
ncbi:hypothetical protein JSY36_18665 [Bacillus sp. H-16]|uniref:hypothetical protein n=1 Tax=Alteribacter salitolerans TaxID=2912333 RepID=UPI001965CBCC|nr:hypothetical protein [Alteribacter salitolerans]MBM7097763.1 hypothetical protein [Alteribacter salitolerans]